ncbi:hypothetical protein Bca4012_083677 [Brassica carinata]
MRIILTRLERFDIRRLLSGIIVTVGLVVLLVLCFGIPCRNAFCLSPVKVSGIVANSSEVVKTEMNHINLSSEDDEYEEETRNNDSSKENVVAISNVKVELNVSVIPSPNVSLGKPEMAVESSVSVRSNDSRESNALSILRRQKQVAATVSISQMNSLLIQSLSSSSHSPKPRWSSARDSEMLSAKSEIENASVVHESLGLDASIYRNISKFLRSYYLMERKLRVYVYKEGNKPIFHRPMPRGIYASEDHLKEYVDMIAAKYKFWNRTGGADHFLVACHDWGNKLTKKHMSNSVRALCNSNVAQGFRIGVDTALPVTYIRSAESPIEYRGGKPPSERKILAFFAGSMHGYLRPILVQLWENKELDMKIFGPMPRDPQGKKQYREYMKSSRYCICARGYEVHTPRVVEAIINECVPVIIADNYVPPFFEVLNWEEFAVFVEEKDIQNLRNILLSIPEERYIGMQARVKTVQQHFLWHKKPVKFDLFHMILHSVWHSRINRLKTRLTRH